MPRVSQGEVWSGDPDPTLGREQRGRRPALVVSIDGMNHGPVGLAIVTPLTSVAREEIPTRMRVDPPEGGLVRPLRDLRAGAQHLDRALRRAPRARRWRHAEQGDSLSSPAHTAAGLTSPDQPARLRGQRAQAARSRARPRRLNGAPSRGGTVRARRIGLPSAPIGFRAPLAWPLGRGASWFGRARTLGPRSSWC
jgi:mRNA-degrading endonuclease toxin of MazEF toxin-antitoxin module